MTNEMFEEAHKHYKVIKKMERVIEDLDAFISLCEDEYGFWGGIHKKPDNYAFEEVEKYLGQFTWDKQTAIAQYIKSLAESQKTVYECLFFGL